MTCPSCGQSNTDRVARTIDLGSFLFRQRMCACGHHWTTQEVEFVGAPIQFGVPSNASSVISGSRVQRLLPLQTPGISATGAQRPPPIASNHPSRALAARGGYGGGVSGDRSGSDPESGLPEATTTVSQGADQARARRVRGAASEYPEAFLKIWGHNGKRGTKLPALKKWVELGRPDPDAVNRAWDAYMLSDRPSRGFVKDLLSWLHQGGHMQEWEPARQAPQQQPQPRPVRDWQTLTD